MFVHEKCKWENVSNSIITFSLRRYRVPQNLNFYFSLQNLQVLIDPNRKPAHAHKRTYNRSHIKDVALIIPGPMDGTANAEHCDVVLTLRDGKLYRINEIHKFYDALQYVLLFPRGETGYELYKTMTNGKTLTPTKYYIYRLM